MRTSGTIILWTSLVVAAPAAAETIELTNGDTLTGTVVEVTESTVVVDHPVLGRLALPVSDVHLIDGGTLPLSGAAPASAAEPAAGGEAAPEPAPAPAPAPAPSVSAAVAEVTTLEESPRGIFGTGLFDGWDSSLTIGFSGTQGNSENTSLNAAFQTVYKDERDRINWKSTYFTATDNGDRSQNEFKTEITRDWLFPDNPLFIFSNGYYQYDQFESWENRVSGYGGLGYTLIDNPDIEVNTRFGLGATYEFGEVNEITPEALVGAAVARWQLTEDQTLSISNTLYPSLENLGEFRNLTDIEWKIKISDSDGLSLKLGLKNEYESKTQNDDKHNDLKYYGAVVFDF